MNKYYPNEKNGKNENLCVSAPIFNIHMEEKLYSKLSKVKNKVK